MKVRPLQQRFERTVVAVLPARWRQRLQAAHAANKAVVRAGAWLIVFVVMAKAVAALKEVAVAYRYGTSPVLEGYLLAFNLATWPVSLALGVMSAVLVPVLVRMQQTSPDGGGQWQRQIAAWVWGIALLVGGLVAVSLPPLIRSGWLGLDAAGREAAIATSPFMAVVSAFGIVAGWHACQLMSRQRHANTLLEGAPAAAILVAVLLVPAGGVEVLSWGTVWGFALQMGLLALMVTLAGMPVVPSLNATQRLDRTLLERSGVLLASQTILGLGGVIDQIVLAHLPSGELARYGYANRVMALVLTLSATVVGRALLPVLAGLDAEQSRLIARRWAWLFFWAGVAGAALLAAMAPFVIELLFQRGAFTPEDSAATARILAWMALQLPMYLVEMVWAQWILTQPRLIRALWWSSVGGLLAKWVVMVALIAGYDWGSEAVALGLAVAKMSSVVVLWYFISIRK